MIVTGVQTCARPISANQGAFHETLNLASVWKAPVVFVVEDNSYGISVSKADCTAVARNSDRAVAYNMPGLHVPNNDPDQVYSLAGEAVMRARFGDGPSLIEIETTRLEGHFMGDPEEYRPDGEVEKLRKNDPIPAYRARLEAEGVASVALDASEARARAEVNAAFEHARSSDLPPPEDALQKIFAERV